MLFGCGLSNLFFWTKGWDASLYSLLLTTHKSKCFMLSNIFFFLLLYTSLMFLICCSWAFCFPSSLFNFILVLYLVRFCPCIFLFILIRREIAITIGSHPIMLVEFELKISSIEMDNSTTRPSLIRLHCHWQFETITLQNYHRASS